MDPTTLNTIVGIVGAIVGIIGIIVGIIGLKSVTTAIKIKNSINADTVQQAEIINNGLDAYAVIRLSQETTKEELEKIIENLQLPSRKEIQELKEEMDNIPRLDVRVEGDTLIFDGGNVVKK